MNDERFTSSKILSNFNKSLNEVLFHTKKLRQAIIVCLLVFLVIKFDFFPRGGIYFSDSTLKMILFIVQWEIRSLYRKFSEKKK